ncbi:hypothetical protein [Archangium lansingense]|uniref:Uncharacterized protein n=1 Tax=Archangium lansingense TaxID=2995310 RepID=A0ABT4A5N4_9BACT|nr:hypothetical protein [Archangium lansinium]MCY1076282.1 hypothetical protein [Archangium lansinium]
MNPRWLRMAVNVDEQLGIVQTRWQDTGFLYGSFGGFSGRASPRSAPPSV